MWFVRVRIPNWGLFGNFEVVVRLDPFSSTKDGYVSDPDPVLLIFSLLKENPCNEFFISFK